jgi:hypothetical protein
MAAQQSLPGTITAGATVTVDGLRGQWRVLAPARSNDPDDPAWAVQHTTRGTGRVFRQSKLTLTRSAPMTGGKQR